MEQKFTKGTEMFMMFQDYWGFVQRNYIPESDDRFWMNLNAEADALAKKYKNGQYIRGLILSFVNDLECRAKASGV